MENHEPRLYDVKVSQLAKLDAIAKDQQKLDSALGNRLDALGSEDRLIQAARALFGREVDDTIDEFIKPGQPGYIYKEARLRTLEAMTKARQEPPAHRPEPDDSIPRPPKLVEPDLTAGTHAEPPQPRL